MGGLVFRNLYTPSMTNLGTDVDDNQYSHPRVGAYPLLLELAVAAFLRLRRRMDENRDIRSTLGHHTGNLLGKSCTTHLRLTI